MQGTTAIAVGALLFGLLLIIAAVMLVQESRRRFEVRPPEYIIEEAVRFVQARLEPDARDRLRAGGIRRILEWQVHFLQRLAKQDKHIPIVVGITDGTVEFIAERLTASGYAASRADIAAVLEAQGQYLVSIGAVGGTADEVFE